MGAHVLEKFLNPKSIAIIGAGENPLRINGRALMFMLRHNSQAKLLPVNPSRDEVQGVRCYRKIAELPEAPDVAMVIVNKEMVLESIDELGKIGCPFAIVTSSGYAETGDQGLKDQINILSKARQHGMRVMGPNCMGLINVQAPIILSWCATLEREPGDLLPGDVALISQSGALLGSIWDMSMGHGLGYSCLLSTGNEVDLDASDFIEYFAQDPNTKVITAFIEAVRNPARFLNAIALAHEQKKPIVIYKVGRTFEGARSAASHTGAIVGSDTTFEAMCRSHGIVRVNSLNALATTAMVLRCQPSAQGSRLGIFSCSGGAAGLISDQTPSRGLSIGQPSREFEKTMTTMLGWHPPHNPLDIAKGPLKSFDVLTQAMERFVNEQSFDQIIILMTMVYFQKVAPRLMLEGLKHKPPQKPVMGCWIGDKVAETPRKEMNEGGIPTFRDIEACLDAAKALAFLGRYREKLFKGFKPAPPPLGSRQKALTLIEQCSRRLDEESSKKILSLYGLKIPDGRLVSSPKEAKKAAEEIGYPLVVKGISPDVLHKTEAGAVRLRVGSIQEVEEAFTQVSASVQASGGDKSFRGVLLERMQPEPIAEVIIGSTSDAHGFHTMIFGLGGLWVEIMKDISMRLVPINQIDAEEMIDELSGRKILEGFRGRPPASRKVLTQTLMQLSSMIWDLKDQISEVDVNPILVYSNDAVAVDALIRLR